VRAQSSVRTHNGVRTHNTRSACVTTLPTPATLLTQPVLRDAAACVPTRLNFPDVHLRYSGLKVRFRLASRYGPLDRLYGSSKTTYRCRPRSTGWDGDNLIVARQRRCSVGTSTAIICGGLWVNSGVICDLENTSYGYIQCGAMCLLGMEGIFFVYMEGPTASGEWTEAQSFVSTTCGALWR
jgi:hypothetical protein